MSDRMVAASSLALEATCALCGHEWRRHDPANGCCDAPAITAHGVCPCGRDMAWMRERSAGLSRGALDGGAESVARVIADELSAAAITLCGPTTPESTREALGRIHRALDMLGATR